MKIFALIAILVFSLILASCVPGGSRPAQGWAGAVFHNEVVYTGSMDGKVMAIDSSTRDLQWSYTFTVPSSGMSCGRGSSSTTIYGTPVVDGDLVYVGSYSGKVLALSTLARSQGLSFPQKRNGEWEWDCPKMKTGSSGIIASLVINENAIYLSSSNGRVYSLDKEFGDLNWESDILDEKLWTALVIQGDTIYVSTFDGHVYTLSVRTGDLLPWAFESEVGFVSTPVIYKDTVFVGSFNNNLYAIKIGGSELLWSFPGDKWFWAAPIVNEGVVYAGCLDGNIYAIEAETGKELWRFDAGSPVVSSPVLKDNLLVVASEAGVVYVLKTDVAVANRVVNNISVGALVRAPLYVQGDVAYVRAQDNCVYALDIRSGGIKWKFPLTIKQES